MNNRIGIALKRCRTQLGLTQKQLAEKAQCVQSLVSQIESGDIDALASTLIRIFEAMGVNMAYEVYGEQVIPPAVGCTGEEFDKIQKFVQAHTTISEGFSRLWIGTKCLFHQEKSSGPSILKQVFSYPEIKAAILAA